MSLPRAAVRVVTERTKMAMPKRHWPVPDVGGGYFLRCPGHVGNGWHRGKRSAAMRWLSAWPMAACPRTSRLPCGSSLEASALLTARRWSSSTHPKLQLLTHGTQALEPKLTNILVPPP